VKRLLYIAALLVLVFIVFSQVMFLLLAHDIPRLPDDLKLLASFPATEVYGRNGELISTSGGREYVSLDRISPYFQKAVIAVEDKRFYRHHGIDHIATLRALLQNIVQLGDAPGGSTITQQLAKNLFFSFSRSWKRKLLEAMAAMAIEDRFSKEEILEAYCNLVSFGQYSYGIERASETYFGKHASDLELHEAALLAGLPNSPSRLNPLNHPDRARKRQMIILRRMADLGTISAQAVDSLAALPIELTGKSRIGRGSFAVDYALDLARATVGSDPVNYGGIRITTSIDPQLQDLAQRSLSVGLDALEKKLKPQKTGEESRLEGALVAIDIGSGQIVALVGGRDYITSPYNRAINSHRQPGSAFKPVIYLAAIEEPDINPATIFEDKPIELRIDKRHTWKPRNFDNQYLGPMTLKMALMKSRNTIAAQLIGIVGPEKTVKTARALGVKSKLEPHLAQSLGGQGVTPLDMADMYATLARGGEALESHLVNRIEVRGGELLYEHFAVSESRFAPETAYQLLDMMTGVLDGGTGVVVRKLGFKGVAAGKTGTSNDYRDAWFVGATPYMVAAVWVGYDDFRGMRLKNGRGITGARGAAPIWADFMIKATAHEPTREFIRPERVGRYYVEPYRGTVSREMREGYIPVALLEEDAEKLIAEAASDSLNRAILDTTSRAGADSSSP